MALPTDAKARKDVPLARGVLDYFPDALCEVAEVSRIGNEQHNPGQPMHWAKEKSSDEADALLRHLAERGTRDTDGQRHSAKVAWRALALLQREIEAERVVCDCTCSCRHQPVCGACAENVHISKGPLNFSGRSTSPGICRCDCKHYPTTLCDLCKNGWHVP